MKDLFNKNMQLRKQRTNCLQLFFTKGTNCRRSYVVAIVFSIEDHITAWEGFQTDGIETTVLMKFCNLTGGDKPLKVKNRH